MEGQYDICSSVIFLNTLWINISHYLFPVAVVFNVNSQLLDTQDLHLNSLSVYFSK